MTSTARSSVWMFLGFFSAACSATAPQRAVHEQPRDSSAVIQHEPSPTKQPSAPLIVAGDEPPAAPPPPPPTPVAITPGNELSISESNLATFATDPRPVRWSPRPTQRLVSELQSLESLLASVLAASPDRPKLLRRLAETYVELKNVALRDKTAAQAVLDTPGSSANKESIQKEIVRAEKIATAAQNAAVKHYTTLITRYPNACMATNSPDPLAARVCLDEPLYYLGLELQQMGKSADARRSFLQLIKEYPQSPLLPRAYLAFGEFFFEEALTDSSKWEFARRMYEKVVESPPEKNEVWGYAQFRLAQVLAQMQDKPAALDACGKALQFSTKFGGLRIALPLGIAARRGFVLLYASVGKPRVAAQFFRRVSGDAPGQNGHLFAMLDALIHEYRREGKDADVAEVCKDFVGAQEGPTSCRSGSAPAQITQ